MFFADCYFPFSQLFEDEAPTTCTNRSRKERKVEFEETLLSNGKVVGEGKFHLKVSHKNFYRQAKACARTEDGVINMTPEFQVYSTGNSATSEYIDRLSDLQRRISGKNVELNNLDLSCCARRK